MAKQATKAAVGPAPTPVMVNKGLPWMFILGISALMLLAVFGLWSGLSGASGFTLPFVFKPTLWLGLILLIYSYYARFKPLGWIIWFAAVALLLFAWFGPTRTGQIAQGVSSAADKVADGATNLVTTGTTKSAAQLAAEDKARRDEELHQAKVRGTETAAYDAEAEKNKPLTEAAFTTKTVGAFAPIVIKSGTEIGPITLYKGTCPYWYKSGMGMIEIYSRADLTKKKVKADLTESYGIDSWGHPGAAKEMYIKALEGDIKIELERREGGNSCK